MHKMVKPKCLIAKISGKGRTSCMALKAAIENIKNLIISCTEKGSQDNHFLLDAYKTFDKDPEENIQQPALMLADGHSSSFNYIQVMHFLREKSIYSFIIPPDTNGVTQLLDQSPNQNLTMNITS